MPQARAKRFLSPRCHPSRTVMGREGPRNTGLMPGLSALESDVWRHIAKYGSRGFWSWPNTRPNTDRSV